MKKNLPAASVPKASCIPGKTTIVPPSRGVLPATLQGTGGADIPLYPLSNYLR